MRRSWAVCRREFESFFVTPVGYVVLATFGVISGLGFCASFLHYAKVSQSPADYAYPGVPDFEEVLLSPYLVFCGLLVMFITPLITMRLLADERHRGTMELLLTHPLRDRDIIFGKYLAALGMLCVLLCLVGVNLCIVGWFVDVEVVVLLFGLFAVFLMGGAFMSLGLFVSALARNPMTAAVLTFGTTLIFYILGALGEELPRRYPAPEAWPDTLRSLAETVYAVLRQMIIEMPLDTHAEQMAQGIFQPKDVVYYVLFTAFFLFLTFRAFESRQWRA